MITHKRAEGNVASLLCALSFATGLGFGGHMEHGLGTAALGLSIADALLLDQEEREAIFYGALLKDVACTACSAGMAAFLPDEEQVSLADVILLDPSSLSDMMGWLSKYLQLDARFPQRIAKLFSFMVQCGPIIKESMRSHCEVAELFARQLGFPEPVQQALRFQWERWDGRGMAYGLAGVSIPRTARLLHLVQVLDLTYRMAGPAATEQIARDKRGSRFDPEGVDAFLAIAQQVDFWRTFEAQSTQEALLARRPATVADRAQQGQIERVCEVLADFVDVKTRETWHHSRSVARMAGIIGTCLGLDSGTMRKLRCAGLVHDVGKVAVPFALLSREKQLSASEQETYRLHVYYTQRILERVAGLQDLAPAAAAHHEWMNGQGYHRQLRGEQIPLHGRILAVADAYTRLVQQQEQKDPLEALQAMRADVDIRFDRVCYEALVTAITRPGEAEVQPLRPRNVGNLTEREVEVLRLLAQGQNSRQIAHTLDISRKTVEHHLAHVYNKIGVTCQTAAVVYAVQQGLV